MTLEPGAFIGEGSEPSELRMPTGHVARTVLLIALGLLSSCAGGGREPLSYSPQSSSYPEPGPRDDPWGPYINEASARFGVPASWVRAVMHQESGGHEYLDGQPITSSAGAIGLMQLMPDTYADLQAQYNLGGDPYDPHDNILAGTAYIRQMYNKYGSPGFLAAYNAGPARVDDYLAGVSGLPAETVDYVAAITPHLGDGAAPIEVASADTGPVVASNTGVVSRAGCVADPDAAYDPSSPCATSSAAPVERPDPVSRDCIADPNAAFDPDRPCMTAPTAQPAIQTVAYEIPPPAPVAPAIASGSALGTYAPPARPSVLAPPLMSRPLAMSSDEQAGPTTIGPWGIQVGAFGAVQEAHFATDIARDALSRRLGTTRPSIEPVRGLGGHVLYRARLVGLDRSGAASACSLLRAQGLPCMAVPPGA